MLDSSAPASLIWDVATLLRADGFAVPPAQEMPVPAEPGVMDPAANGLPSAAADDDDVNVEDDGDVISAEQQYVGRVQEAMMESTPHPTSSALAQVRPFWLSRLLTLNGVALLCIMINGQ